MQPAKVMGRSERQLLEKKGIEFLHYIGFKVPQFIRLYTAVTAQQIKISEAES
jgi:hypothetical protein